MMYERKKILTVSGLILVTLISLVGLYLGNKWCWWKSACNTEYDPKYTFLDYCEDDDLASAATNQTVDALKNIVGKKDCQEAFRALAEKRTLILTSQNLTSLRPLNGLRNLEALVMSGNNIDDLRPLENLQELRALSLSHARIKDISPLSALKKLEILTLSDNQIKDIAPLKALQALKHVNLSANKIEDVSALKDLAHLTRYDSWEGLWLKDISLGTTHTATEANCPTGAGVNPAVSSFCHGLREKS